MNQSTRRQFIKQMTAASVAIPTMLPGLSLSAPPSSRLQHASVGVGGMMGGADLGSIIASGKVDVVAICDIDENNLAAGAARAPKARKYRDWRQMLEAEADKIDSVNVTTPDHMHGPIAYSAIQMGKHVYCQKPLTHEVREARMLRMAAREKKVVTQMGIQIHSHVVYRRAARLIHDGAIGKVRRWYSWHGPSPWPTGGRPAGSDPVPAGVDWDLWLGVAPRRPYKADIYHPIKWRGWQDFGSGVLGDFACHIFDPVFMALDLGEAISVKARAAEDNHETWPEWQIVDYEFPGTKYTAGDTIKGVWYDGGKYPPRELLPMVGDRQLPGGGSYLIGEQGCMIIPHYAEPILLPEAKFANYKRPELEPVDHYAQWVEACLGNGRATANFDFSGPLAETVQLGNVAARMPGVKLEWDAANAKITNVAKANKLLKRKYREGWTIKGIG